MTNAALSLRAAVFERLKTDSVLTGLIGADRVFDTPPRGQAYPYLVVEGLGSAPLLNDREEGEVHELVLAVFSRQPSRDEALQAVSRCTDILVETPPALSDHHLVGLQAADMRSRLLRDGRTFRAEVSLRAVTEPLA